MSESGTTVLLIRHALTDAVGAWLAGREGDVPLNQVGRAQAERLRDRLTQVNLSAIYTSPVQRAVETAATVARDRGLPAAPRMELVEVEFGGWAGQRFDALAQDPRWRRFNVHRSMAAVPGGERAIDVQARIVRFLDELRTRHPNGTVACVSHADVIRLAILHLAGAPLDFIHRFDVSPASITAVLLYEDSSVLLYVNERDPLARLR